MHSKRMRRMDVVLVVGTRRSDVAIRRAGAHERRTPSVRGPGARQASPRESGSPSAPLRASSLPHSIGGFAGGLAEASGDRFGDSGDTQVRRPPTAMLLTRVWRHCGTQRWLAERRADWWWEAACCQAMQTLRRLEHRSMRTPKRQYL